MKKVQNISNKDINKKIAEITGIKLESVEKVSKAIPKSIAHLIKERGKEKDYSYDVGDKILIKTPIARIDAELVNVDVNGVSIPNFQISSRLESSIADELKHNISVGKKNKAA